MKISEDEIRELWRIRLAAFSSRKPRWIYEVIILFGFLLIIPGILLKFQISEMLWLIVGYGAYVVLSLVMLTLLFGIQKRRIFRVFRHQLRTLLYTIQDIYSMSLFSIIFFYIGFLILRRNTEVMSLGFELMGQTILVVYAFVALSMLVLSPWFSIQKAKNQLNRDPEQNYLPWWLTLVSAAPGVGLIVVRLFSRISLMPFLAIVLSFAVSFLLGAFSVQGLFEVMLLGVRRWPIVRKLKNTYVIME